MKSLKNLCLTILLGCSLSTYGQSPLGPAPVIQQQGKPSLEVAKEQDQPEQTFVLPWVIRLGIPVAVVTLLTAAHLGGQISQDSINSAHYYELAEGKSLAQIREWMNDVIPGGDYDLNEEKGINKTNRILNLVTKINFEEYKFPFIVPVTDSNGNILSLKIAEFKRVGTSLEGRSIINGQNKEWQELANVFKQEADNASAGNTSEAP